MASRAGFPLRRQADRGARRAPRAVRHAPHLAQPPPGVGDRLGHRPADQPRRVRPLDVALLQPAVLVPLRNPHRQVVPRLHPGRQNRLRRRPPQRRGRPGRRHRRVEQVTHRRVPGATHHVVRPADALGTPVQQPGRQVANVHVLDRQVTRPRCQHLAAPGDPVQPPRQPPDVLPRPEDQPGARQQRPVTEHPRRGEFPAGLVRRIVTVVVGVRVRRHRRRLLAGAELDGWRVHRAAGHVHVVRHGVDERRRRVPYRPGRAVPRVHHQVPLAAGERGQPVRRGPVTPQPVYAVRHPPVYAPVEHCHLPVAAYRLGHHGTADKARTAKHQESHASQRAAPRRPAGPRSR